MKEGSEVDYKVNYIRDRYKLQSNFLVAKLSGKPGGKLVKLKAELNRTKVFNQHDSISPKNSIMKFFFILLLLHEELIENQFQNILHYTLYILHLNYSKTKEILCNRKLVRQSIPSPPLLFLLLWLMLHKMKHTTTTTTTSITTIIIITLQSQDNVIFCYYLTMMTTIILIRLFIFVSFCRIEMTHIQFDLPIYPSKILLLVCQFDSFLRERGILSLIQELRCLVQATYT